MQGVANLEKAIEKLKKEVGEKRKSGVQSKNDLVLRELRKSLKRKQRRRRALLVQKEKIESAGKKKGKEGGEQG